jgi:hypothetical protein
MPYITEDKRKVLDKIIDRFDNDHYMDDGEVTYVIYKLLLNHVRSNMRYNTLAECMGIIECAKQEFYRRIVAPYEDKKILENGDIQ